MAADDDYEDGGVQENAQPSYQPSSLASYDVPPQEEAPPRYQIPRVGERVTDPALLSRLNGSSSDRSAQPTYKVPEVGEKVTDPALLSRLNGEPQGEGMLMSGLRKAAHNVLPSLGLGGGAAYGAALGAPLGPVGAIGGGLLGGLAGGLLGEKVQETGTKLLGIDDSLQLAANEKLNPVSTFIGGAVPLALSFGVGGVSRGVRALSGALGGGLEAVQEVSRGDDISPLRIAGEAGVGAALGGPRAWAKPFEYSGAQAASGLLKNTRFGPAAAELAAKAEAARAQGQSGAADLFDQLASRAPGGPPEDIAARDAARPPEDAVTAQHGTPGSKGAAGTAEAQHPAPEIPVSDQQIGEGSERRYPKAGEEPVTQPAPEVAARGSTDPTLNAVFEAQRPAAEAPPPPAAEAPAAQPTGEAPRTMAAERAPDEAVRGPSATAQEAPDMQGPEPGKEAVRQRIVEAAARRAEEGVPEGTEPPPLRQPLIRPGAAGGPSPAQQVKPAMPEDLQTGLIASLRRAFVPMASPSARIAGKAVNEAYGPLAQVKEAANARFTNDLHKLGNSLDQPGFERFVDAYESGNAHTLPADQQGLAKALNKNYGRFWDEIKKLPDADKMQATKDFLTHMYDNSNGQVDKFARDWFSASGGSLRKRTFPTYADARAAGLQALSNNPIEHFARYSEGISNYLAQQHVLDALDKDGRIFRATTRAVGASGAPRPLVRNQPPPGYAELKMPGAAKGPFQTAYAPRDIAETLNQYYDAGMRRAGTKDAYDFLRQTKNAWTAMELGLSAYHFTTVGVESMNSGMARALQIAATGDFARATKELLKVPAEPVAGYLYGRGLRQMYREQPVGQGGSFLDKAMLAMHSFNTPDQQRLLEALKAANIQPGNLRATAEYDMTRLGNFYDAHKKGSLMNELDAQLKDVKDAFSQGPFKGTAKAAGAVIDNVRRALQTISKPLFEHYIPELKLGTMMKDMEAFLHANPNVTDGELADYARRVSNSIDNRMGEMNANNWFMNKFAKDLGFLTLRSMAFTVGGPIKEIGGGASSLLRGAARGENRLSLKSPNADPRAAYAVAFVPTIAAISAAYQYMRTGEPPTDWRDLVAPKTGGTLKRVGQQVPERILVPGYHKDFLGYFVNPEGPMKELQNKLAAPFSALLEQATGKDWADRNIVPPRATTAEWWGAHAKALGEHFLPISSKQIAQGKEKGSNLSLPEQAIGMRTPGSYLLNPKALERVLAKKDQAEWKAKENQENRARQERGLPPLPHRPLPPPPQ